jgi:hypothetical protein
VEDWLQTPGRILLSWSIFNPNGPTISCVGIRETGAREELEVFFRWFHFLGGEDYCLGYVNPREQEFRPDLKDVLQHAFLLEAGKGLRRFALVTCVPSVVVPYGPDAVVADVREAFLRSKAIREGDWGEERYFLTKYGAQLFRRAGEETREGYELAKADEAYHDEAGRKALELLYLRHQHIETFREWQPGQYQSRGLAPGDIEAWWDTVTSETFWPVAAAQLAQAWVGASTAANLEVRTPLEEVRDFFVHFSFPLWPETVTMESMRTAMGKATPSANGAQDV